MGETGCVILSEITCSIDGVGVRKGTTVVVSAVIVSVRVDVSSIVELSDEVADRVSVDRFPVKLMEKLFVAESSIVRCCVSESVGDADTIEDTERVRGSLVGERVRENETSAEVDTDDVSVDIKVSDELKEVLLLDVRVTVIERVGVDENENDADQVGVILVSVTIIEGENVEELVIAALRDFDMLKETDAVRELEEESQTEMDGDADNAKVVVIEELTLKLCFTAVPDADAEGDGDGDTDGLTVRDKVALDVCSSVCVDVRDGLLETEADHVSDTSTVQDKDRVERVRDGGGGRVMVSSSVSE